jgi:beta-phosphoglucomutase-like phosphatase (HAD superfamily)
MQPIKGILFEPVGCLAEFPPAPFLEAAARFSGRQQSSKSGSRAYWHLLNLMQLPANESLDALEIEAVERASLYEDVVPALSELRAMGIQLLIASSLSQAAIERFLDQGSLHGFFDELWTRDNARGIKAIPLQRAIEAAGLQPSETMFLTDTAEGLNAARTAGVNAILMMNDPDESMRLAMHDPAGGIVSLHELPDFVRLLQVRTKTSSPAE